MYDVTGVGMGRFLVRTQGKGGEKGRGETFAHQEHAFPIPTKLYSDGVILYYHMPYIA